MKTQEKLVLIITVLISTISYGQRSYEESKSDSLTWYVYQHGRPNTDYLHAQKKVAKNWGVVLKFYISCTSIDGGLTEEENLANQEVFYMLSKAHGEAWRDKFNELVEIEFNGYED